MRYLMLIASLLFLLGCCSSPPSKTHDCVKDDGPAYCKAKEQPGWWKR